MDLKKVLNDRTGIPSVLAKGLTARGTADVVKMEGHRFNSAYFNTDFITNCINEIEVARQRLNIGNDLTNLEKLGLITLMLAQDLHVTLDDIMSDNAADVSAKANSVCGCGHKSHSHLNGSQCFSYNCDCIKYTPVRACTQA